MFALVLGVAVRYWAASQWRVNFDSDEAIFALMAKHIAAGRFMPTVYGTEHLGSTESLLAAWLFRGLGESVMVFRWAALLLMTGFFCLNTIWVARLWGLRPALISLLFLSLPGFHILAWTYQPIGSYAALLFLGTLFLLLLSLRPSSSRHASARDFGLGLTAGLGLWANQMFIVYMAAGLLPAMMGTDAWRWTHGQLESASKHRGVPFAPLTTILLVTLLVAGILAFFSAGCLPRPLFLRISLLAKAALAVGIPILALVIVRATPRPRRAVATTLLFCSGVIAGYAPQWVPWISTGPNPVAVIRPSCPVDIPGRFAFTLRELIPAMLGLPAHHGSWLESGFATVLWAFAGTMTFAALLWYLIRHRDAIHRLFRLLPVSGAQASQLQLLLLFVVPILLGILGSNTVDIHSVRHLVVSWQASAILFAVFLSAVTDARPRLGWALALFWVFGLGIANLAITPGSWNVKFTRYEEGSIKSLETYLSARGVEGGYADYWGAYTLDFLTQEQLMIAPYNGLNRIPAYMSAVESASPFVVLLPVRQSPQATRVDALCDHLSKEHAYSGEGPARGTIAERCRSSTLVSREVIGPWDVWILSDR